jgi:hypothetical protein
MSRVGLGLISSVFLLSVVVSSACSNISDDCETTSTCGPVGGTTAGGTTAGGQSGKSSGGSSSGNVSAGEGGTATAGTGTAGSGGNATAGEGGGGGAGGVVKLPCDGACTAPTAVCDEPSDMCVECLEEADCASGAKKKCDTDTKACVSCLESNDCPTATAAKCDAGACVKCTSNDDCAHVAGKGVCDLAAGECVQCTGKDYASCGMDAGTPLVCDSKLRTCTSNKVHSIGPCKPCVSDAQCKLGQICAVESFGAEKAEVGQFCFWKQGDTANGAPASCATNGRPYVTAIPNQVSVDGASETICGLRVSSCIAANQFSSKDCSTALAADDTKCGFDAPNDAKCVTDGAGFSCTMTCASDDGRDCPLGIQCDTNASPAVCKL